MHRIFDDFMTPGEISTILGLLKNPKGEEDVIKRTEPSMSTDGIDVKTERIALLSYDHADIVYDIMRPKLEAIAKTVEEKLTGMICHTWVPFSPHSDGTTGKDESVTVLIPLEVDPEGAEAHTVLFDQYCFTDNQPLRITMPLLKRFKNRSENQRNYDRYIMEKAGRSAWVQYDELDLWIAELGPPGSLPDDTSLCGPPINLEQWERLTIEAVYNWKVGQAFVFPSRQLHTAGRFDQGDPHLVSKTFLLIKPGDVLKDGI